MNLPQECWCEQSKIMQWLMFLTRTQKRAIWDFTKSSCLSWLSLHCKLCLKAVNFDEAIVVCVLLFCFFQSMSVEQELRRPVGSWGKIHRWSLWPQWPIQRGLTEIAIMEHQLGEKQSRLPRTPQKKAKIKPRQMYTFNIPFS